MIRLLARLFGRKHTEANPARELALIGHRQRHAKVIAAARQLRRELGMPEDHRLTREGSK